MPKVSEKREKIDAAKSGAPKVPGETCPSIDYVQEIIGQIAERGDDWSEKQAGYINDLLEYVREANFELRKSSKYWYEKYKEVL
tara:strand:- start:261 stop:512 length:252 start_codon:yes stop_codon:yes gene_type:complete